MLHAVEQRLLSAIPLFSEILDYMVCGASIVIVQASEEFGSRFLMFLIVQIGITNNDGM